MFDTANRELNRCIILSYPVLSFPTQDYLAPEMLMERPYTTSVDLWAAGVVTYEFLLGHSPFRRHAYLSLPNRLRFLP